MRVRLPVHHDPRQSQPSVEDADHLAAHIGGEWDHEATRGFAHIEAFRRGVGLTPVNPNKVGPTVCPDGTTDCGHAGVASGSGRACLLEPRPLIKRQRQTPTWQSAPAPIALGYRDQDWTWMEFAEEGLEHPYRQGYRAEVQLEAKLHAEAIDQGPASSSPS